MINVNFLNYLKYKSEVYRIFVTFIFFISILIIGLLSVNDYGAVNDEYTHRLNGFITLNYLGEIFLPDITRQYTIDKNFVSFDEMPDQLRYYGGTILHAPLGFLEVIFGIEDKKDVFIFKHYVYFLIFFISLIFFFKILNRRFNSWQYSILGTSLLFLTPRIFANSFYNNMDIPFMSFLIIATYFGVRFLSKSNKKYIFLFSLFSSIAIDIRIVGGILPLVILIIYFSQNLMKKSLKKSVVNLVLIFFMHIIFIILLWPLLWENPIDNLIKIFVNMANHPLDFDVFFFGENINVTNLPWFYLPTWIFISTPILYTLLFLIGIIFFLSAFFNLNSKIKINSTDKIFLLMIMVPAILPILLNSTLYNGWRHFYFIYPYIVYFMVYGIFFLLEKIHIKKINLLFKILIVIGLLDISSWMIQNHPHQYVFFNKIIRKNASANFELDYMAASYKENLDYLVNNENKKNFNIFNASETKIWYPLFSLSKSDRDKIHETDKHKADYWITNYWFDKTIYDENFYNNFEVLKEIKIDGNKINTIFKRKN